MSSVYQAIDENINVPVAVKANLVLTDDYSRQFQREATILATLRHPNLPRVNDYFHVPGQGQYLVMDFIEGEDLRERIERLGQLSEREVIVIGASICDALMYLHKREPPVIHRDIKPGNIRITPEGHVILVDFGLVKLLSGNQQTTTGARAMTPGYSPPEQYGAGRTDERSDIYSLGATLYAALTGQIPEDGLARLTGKEKLTPIRKSRPKVSERLAAIIEKSLEVESDRRFQTAQEFRTALLDAGNMTSIPIETNLITPPPRKTADRPLISTGISQPLISFPISSSQPVRKPNPAFVWLAIAVIVAGLAGIVYEFQTGGISSWLTAGMLSRNNPIVEFTQSPSAPPDPTATRALTPIFDVISMLTPSATPTTGNDAQATPVGGGGGLIAYASNQDTSAMQIWTFDVDTEIRTQITNIPDGACQPTWSPDGQRIAFISPCLSKNEIYEGGRIFIVDLENENTITPLSIPLDPAGDFDPAWSPDGKKIVFSSLRPGNAADTQEKLVHLFLYDFEADTLAEITNTRWRDRQPTWSADGQFIAFVRKVATTEIWVMEANGNNPQRFSGSSTQNYNYPSFSKDGNIIFFTTQSAEGGLPFFSGLRMSNAGLALEFRIPPAGQPHITPAVELDLSADGQWFVFEGWPDGENHEIYISMINGSNIQKLFESPSFEFGAVWQP